jgi:hypothetical protein
VGSNVRKDLIHGFFRAVAALVAGAHRNGHGPQKYVGRRVDLDPSANGRDVLRVQAEQHELTGTDGAGSDP